MKLYRHRVQILGMALSRNKAIARLKSNADTLEEHVAKLAIYDDDLKTKEHWIKEIANYIDDANSVVLKSNNQKPSFDLYDDTLLEGLRETTAEAKMLVNAFRSNNRRTEVYPDFEPSKEMYYRAFLITAIVREFVQNVCTMRNTMSLEDIQNYFIHKFP